MDCSERCEFLAVEAKPCEERISSKAESLNFGPTPVEFALPELKKLSKLRFSCCCEACGTKRCTLAGVERPELLADLAWNVWTRFVKSY
jgi:hypothetical protein